MPSAAEQASIVERIDPYREWRRKEGAPLVGGVYIKDMKQVEVGPWPRKGVNGALCYLDGDDDCDEHIVEIPPGGQSNPEHHMYNEAVYIVSGRGSCAIWHDEQQKQTFEWGEGSVFAIPLNAWCQFFNASGARPARYFSITNLPDMLRQYHNEQFIFDCPFPFEDRYSGEAEYFSGDGTLYRGRLWESNFIPDVRKMKLWEWKERGGGGTNASFMLSAGTMHSHISRFQPGTYKKAHRHGSGAHLYICQGEGYVQMKRGDEPRIRCDWQEGSLYLSGAGPGLWLHQHFNVGADPAAYLVLDANKQSRRYASNRWSANDPTDRSVVADVSEKEGGIQTEYEDEDPEVHRIFEEELAKRGIQCRMKNLVPWCTGVDGPTQKGEWGDEH